MLTLFILLFTSGIDSYVFNFRDNSSLLEHLIDSNYERIQFEYLNKVCKINEEYDNCGPVYEHNCENYSKPIRNRRRKCVPGCFCKNGYVRDLKSRFCILPEFCDSSKMCVQNANFQLCGEECDFCDTNNRLMRRQNCSDCLTGCFCEEGFVRNMLNNKCVSIDSCNQI